MFLIKPNKSKTSEERKSEFLQAITIFSICGCFYHYRLQ